MSLSFRRCFWFPCLFLFTRSCDSGLLESGSQWEPLHCESSFGSLYFLGIQHGCIRVLRSIIVDCNAFCKSVGSITRLERMCLMCMSHRGVGDIGVHVYLCAAVYSSPSFGAFVFTMKTRVGQAFSWPKTKVMKDVASVSPLWA